MEPKEVGEGLLCEGCAEDSKLEERWHLEVELSRIGDKVSQKKECQWRKWRSLGQFCEAETDHWEKKYSLDGKEPLPWLLLLGNRVKEEVRRRN